MVQEAQGGAAIGTGDADRVGSKGHLVAWLPRRLSRSEGLKAPFSSPDARFSPVADFREARCRAFHEQLSCTEETVRVPNLQPKNFSSTAWTRCQVWQGLCVCGSDSVGSDISSQDALCARWDVQLHARQAHPQGWRKRA